MSHTYKAYYGFKKDPFPQDVPTEDLLRLPGMVGVKERLDYVLDIGGVMVITGEIGGGKSTSLRWSRAQYHPSEILVVEIIANSGSIVEMLKQIAWGLDLRPKTSSKAKLTAEAKSAIRDIVQSRRQKIIVMIDEANLLRSEVLAELHTITQFDHDSKALLTLVLCGQTGLLDKLAYRSSQPLASRVSARTHLAPLSRTQMEEYINHHIKIAGLKKGLYDETAVNAIFQGSGGVLRKANALARGGMIAAAVEKKDLVTAEHIRIAASELL